MQVIGLLGRIDDHQIIKTGITTALFNTYHVPRLRMVNTSLIFTFDSVSLYSKSFRSFHFRGTTENRSFSIVQQIAVGL